MASCLCHLVWGNVLAAFAWHGRFKMTGRSGNVQMLLDLEPLRSTMREEVLEGLRKSPKGLPNKYFYDEAGSQLFEQICELEEYYPTRTEWSIMQHAAPEIASLLGSHCLLIEYGSGSSKKTRLLLDALQTPAGYMPIDISKDFLLQSARTLAALYPQLEVLPVCADYTSDLVIPSLAAPVERRMVYFPGSAIGN